MTFYIKQGDTSPSISASLNDASGNAVDISGASVRFHMRLMGAKSTTVDAVATVTEASSGAVAYEWDAADTAEAGSYQAEFEVTFADGGVETFPNAGYIPIQIIEEIA